MIIKVDPRYFRPTEVDTLLGDSSKAREKLGWEPKITVENMCKEMIKSDFNIAKQHALLLSGGFNPSLPSE